jgi:predicted dinucleotide-binding enzyme
MKTGILGPGDVGRKLGHGLIEIGHTVKIETSDPTKESIRKWLERHGEKASAGSPGEAAAYGDACHGHFTPPL